jgi:ABC-type uncharacterized transport system substrate-binding protein
MTYTANQADRWRSLTTYVDKILKGATPADLPVQRPMKFDLSTWTKLISYFRPADPQCLRETI